MSDTHKSDRALQDLLGSYRVEMPDAALTGKILNLGVQQKAKRKRIRNWLIGAGLVGIGLAGGLSGAATVAIITPMQPYVRADQETAFGMVQTDNEAYRLQEEQ